MRLNTWMQRNTERLDGRRVVITGSTGGLGQALCRHLLGLGAELILVDRNATRSHALRERLLSEYDNARVTCISADMEKIDEVRAATEELIGLEPDVVILNAGAYNIPRHACESGCNNVFQINFLSPYYMVRHLLPTLKKRNGRVVAVGSIAHRYSVSDPADVDFSKRRASSKVYGNAKRYLMFSLYELFKEEQEASLSVVHPGISFTGITAHYPKVIFAIIKHPMKVIFMKPRRAILSAVKGIFTETPYHTWIGPRVFDVWGLPTLRRLRSCSKEESRAIAERAEALLETMEKTTTE